ncbi:sideroflexin-4 isoform X1 [Physeter macrocephalus]|uniref:Sideroflexin-4 isoform X1 n=1 Tax=Physeter macrocephalus TaxID=9755 RepID=A0A455B2M2_PHYMC|nr:sideroflexin-4 isoform X1 [Physeter catodon]|eukprot:XP_028343012.1 sideroflexin-4 isoform X1 [Physeter catodon]
MLQEESPIRFSKIMLTAIITVYLGFSAAINLSGALAPLKSFIQRFLQWTELLDPTNLVVSIEKIEKSRQLLLTHEDASRSDLEDKRVQEAWKRSLSTVHPDNSKLIPGPFRPAALLPFTAPMVFLSMLPVKSLKSMILPQVSFYTYSTVFNIVNGNASYDRRPHESILLGAGVIASSTFFGLFPRLLQVRFSLNSILSRNVIPVIILAQLSGMNVVASRSLEPLRGIEVMDKEGSVIGYSRKAGTKVGGRTTWSCKLLAFWAKN